MARPRLTDARVCKHCGKKVYRMSAREVLHELGRALGKLERVDQEREHHDKLDRQYHAAAAATRGAHQALLDLRYLTMQVAGRCMSGECFTRELASLRGSLERELREREEGLSRVIYGADSKFQAIGPTPPNRETEFRHRGDGGGIDADWQPAVTSQSAEGSR